MNYEGILQDTVESIYGDALRVEKLRPRFMNQHVMAAEDLTKLTIVHPGKRRKWCPRCTNLMWKSLRENFGTVYDHADNRDYSRWVILYDCWKPTWGAAEESRPLLPCRYQPGFAMHFWNKDEGTQERLTNFKIGDIYILYMHNATEETLKMHMDGFAEFSVRPQQDTVQPRRLHTTTASCEYPSLNPMQLMVTYEDRQPEQRSYLGDVWNRYVTRNPLRTGGHVSYAFAVRIEPAKLLASIPNFDLDHRREPMRVAHHPFGAPVSRSVSNSTATTSGGGSSVYLLDDHQKRAAGDDENSHASKLKHTAKALMIASRQFSRIPSTAPPEENPLASLGDSRSLADIVKRSESLASLGSSQKNLLVRRNSK